MRDKVDVSNYVPYLSRSFILKGHVLWCGSMFFFSFFWRGGNVTN